MLGPELSLIVLRCADLNASRVFYSTVGLEFVQERHGNGPEHLAANFNGQVLELYPLRESSVVGEGLGRIGFRVSSVDETVRQLAESGIEVVSEPRQTDWGYSTVVRDPDGRTVELTELT